MTSTLGKRAVKQPLYSHLAKVIQLLYSFGETDTLNVNREVFYNKCLTKSLN